MPNPNDWVIINDANDLFFTGYVGETPSWGIIDNAVTYGTEQAAQDVCNTLALGGIRPTHPPTH